MLTRKVTHVVAASAIIAAVVFASCNKELNSSANSAQSPQSEESLKVMMSENGNNPDEASVNAMQSGNIQTQGEENHYLYTETNSTDNGIMVFKIQEDGSLHLRGTTPSGGKGTGTVLGPQGALALNKYHTLLFAVNAGSNSVSSFKVKGNGNITLAYTAKTKGKTPVSVAVYENMLYVLNTGSDDIHGFWIGEDGELTDIEGSDKHLSGNAVVAPQISFSPYGDWIIVTEKATNMISTFKVRENGSAAPGIFTPSIGKTPFGFGFARDKYMIVSNAEANGVNSGTATSYTLGSDGVPYNINGYVTDYQTAPCWFAIAKYGRFAYTTNTMSNSVSSYYIAPWGGLYLAQSVAATTDKQPLDIVVADNNYFVYVLNGEGQSIGIYHRKAYGGLELAGKKSGTTPYGTGLVTF